MPDTASKKLSASSIGMSRISAIVLPLKYTWSVSRLGGLRRTDDPPSPDREERDRETRSR